MSENQKSVGLRIALPNGSLEEGTLRLFEEANLKIWKDSRKHVALIYSPLILRVTFMRPQHIPALVERGVYDVGICGSDCIEESETHVIQIAELPYGRGASNGVAKVVLVTSKENPVETIEQVERESVVLSEYPSITKRAFAQRMPVDIRFSYGGTEAHIPGDYRYGVCLTDTGASLKANGLKVIHTLLETHTCLITSREILSTTAESPKEHESKKLVVALKHLLLGTLAARERVFLVMNVQTRSKERLLKQLPALKTPTVTPLADGDYFSVGAVVLKDELNALIPALLMNGAEDLVEMPISKVIRSW
ncbi:MAG TPA: ATP phosphoribosyltransferase [Candidatus Taylorbacteria bacterium]|nr:MAG: ATP phosphoribosyltransferase [Parcubacteria group bacterium GW2011_GWA2_47_64]KKU96297.1 MAG: ATP phosphoribosyltransferase [Parcubacteria group bacterium GW2011_GWC2_48_17]HBV01224.1 ATP phosphoribosyltransferase [Candidatus Taylorbacteria bacterium]